MLIACAIVHRLHASRAESSDRALDTVAEGDGGVSEGDAEVLACRFGCGRRYEGGRGRY